MAGENCRTGCRTRNHTSWGECARAANMSIAAGESAPAFYGGNTYTSSKQWDRELDAYDRARAEGISPEGTTMNKINAAVEATKLLGRPYKAEVDPPAHMINSKNTASYVNATTAVS